MSKHFHIGDVLSITTGRLVSPTHIDGVYDILNYMTGDNLFTHQLPRAAEQCKPELLRQHPALAAVDVSEINETNWQWWLDEQVAAFGESLTVEPLCPADYEHQDPIEELTAKIGKDRVIVVSAPNANPGP